MRQNSGLKLLQAGLILALCSGAGISGGGPRAQDSDKDDDKSKKPVLTERQQKVAELFKATKVSFDKDRIVLEYNFESLEQGLTDDWLPALDSKNMRIRWSRGGEGTFTTIERGIILGDTGEWFHNAVFSNNVEVEVDLMPVSPFKSGNLMAAVFFNEKKKRSIGTNEGYQLVCLNARKHAKAPMPKEEGKVNSNERHRMGFTYDAKGLSSSRNGRKVTDSSSNPKFTEGLETGRIGFVWSGSIQYFILKVTIKGKLDEKWLASKIGEDPAPKSAPVSTKPAATGADKSKDSGKAKADSSKAKGAVKSGKGS